MLRRYSGKKDEGRSSPATLRQPNYPATLPTTKSKDVACIFCKHRFYIGRDLKSNYSPLLLPCGHATCSTCEAFRAIRPCPVCPEELVDDEIRKRLPHNMYVIGLMHAINSSPIHVEDPDMSFHVPYNSIARHNFDQGPCSECGMLANYNCKNCNVLFCNLCFKKIHRKALQNHETVSLNKNAVELPIYTFCPEHETDASEYYCEDCDLECCSHCIIKIHKDHTTVRQSEKNEELMPEFLAAYMKLQETRARTHQTLKNLTSKMVCTEAMEKSQRIENEITAHFVQLHGILQNTEQKLKDKLYEQRNRLRQDVEECRAALACQEEKLASATALAATAESNYSRVNVKRFTEKLLELADSPCHILQKDDYDGEIRMEINDSVLDSIKQHVQLHVPDVPRFNLVTTDQLPENYELEPLPVNETMNSSFKMSSRRDLSSSGLSTASHSSSNPSLDESLTPEPSSMEKGSSERVKVTYIKDPTDFYVQRISEKRMLTEIETEMAKYAENNPTPPEEISLNRMYVVQNSTELKWCRGRVTKAFAQPGSTEASVFEVYFIDYGTTEYEVNLERIRNAIPAFNLTAGLAVHCTLYEIAPMNEEWGENVLTEFRNKVAGMVVVMKIMNISDLIYTVDLLILHKNKSYLSIHDWLIDTNLARVMSFYKLKRMNPESVNRFYFEEIPVEKYSRVEVSYVESPNCIYVRKKNNKEFKEKMLSFEPQYATFLRQEDLTVKYPEYGTSVALRHGSSWIRGIITNIYTEETKVKVFLVDIGSTAVVDYSKVTRLPNRFCKWNAQAIKISLIDIKPVNNEVWSTDSIGYLKSNLEGRTVKVFPFSKIEDTYNVCIYLSNDANVNANLVSMNYAESTGSHSLHTTLNKDINSISKKLRKKMTKKMKSVYEIIQEKPTVSPKKKHVKTIEESDPFKVRVLINKIVSPDDIYVSEPSNVEFYETMVGKMQKFYESNVGVCEGEMQPNFYYCVYSRKDKQFCRAQFLEMVDTSTARMSLVDLAEVEEIPVEHIQPLDRSFLDLPKYIFRIKLAGIRPCGGSNVWQSSSCQKLKDIIHDTGDTKYYITLVGLLEEDGAMPVDLYIRRNVVTGPTEPNRKETLSVARRLVEEGLALPIRGYLESDGKSLAVELKKKLQLDSSLIESTRETTDSYMTPIEEESTINGSSDEEVENNKANGIEEVKDKSLEDVSSESTALPPKVSEWIPAAHILEDTFNASCTYVDYDCAAYFHPDTKEYNETLQFITSKLDKHYSSRSIKKYDHTWEAGDLCIANYHFDKKWYRGKILEVISIQTLKVFFVDYGNVEECPVGAVKKRIILEQIPIQCTRANVVGIKPLYNKWKSDDLDVIHKVVVSNPCRIKVVSRPPNPWKVAIWIIENSSFYSLPWYLQNKTQVRCIAEDISKFCVDDVTSMNSEETYSMTNGSTLIKPITIPINGKDTSESSDEEYEFETDTGFDTSSKDSVIIDSNKDNCSDTMRDDEDLMLEVTMKMNNVDFSTAINNSLGSNCSKKSSSKSSVVSYVSIDSQSRAPLHVYETEETDSMDYYSLNANESENTISYNGDTEKFLSGNSVHLNDIDLNDRFDVQSIQSEALYNGMNNADLVASTPLNSSFQDDFSECIAQPIDFYMYNIKSFEMGLGQAFTETKMSGYIIKTSNEELNKWITMCNKVHEEIQDFAEEQPIFILGTGQFCIAKYDDGLWYRARIVKNVVASIRDGIQVEFIDFGNRMIVDHTCIRCIKKKWLEIPWMSFYFKLHDVQVVGNKKRTREAMDAVLGQRERYTVVVKKYEPILELELYLDADCKNLVYAPLIENNLLKIVDLVD